MNFSVTLKDGTEYKHADLTNAGLAYLPCNRNGPSVEHKHVGIWDCDPQEFAALFNSIDDRIFYDSTGVQILTGKHSTRDGLHLLDFDIERAFIDNYPEHYQKVNALIENNTEGEVCAIRTKGGGMRFSVFTDPPPHGFYKHQYRDKETKGCVFEFFYGRNALSRIDDRYVQARGSLLAIPTMPYSTIDAIRRIVKEVAVLEEKEQGDAYTKGGENKGKGKGKGKRAKVEEQCAFFAEKKFLPMGMQTALQEKDIRFVALHGESLLRVYHEGVYVPEDKAPRHKRLLPAMQEIMGTERFKVSHYNEVRAMLTEDISDRDDFDPPNLLCLKNGILNTTNAELTPHTPDTLFLRKLPVNFDKKARCPAIEQWLVDVLEGDHAQIRLFCEAVGYTLLNTTELQKMFILVGPTKTGKSTAANLLKALIGTENLTTLTLQEIDDDEVRFKRATLIGKVANISADISHRALRGDGHVKSIVAGDTISAEVKGKDPFEFTPNVTLWAMSNAMVRSYDRSDAWYERLLIIEFQKQFLPGTDSPPDTKLLDKLTTQDELDGFFLLSLMGGVDALAKQAFSETEKQADAVENAKGLNDHVFGFLQEMNAIQWEDADFYQEYKAWLELEDTSARVLSKRKLAEAVKPHGWQRVKRGPRGEQRFVWIPKS